MTEDLKASRWNDYQAAWSNISTAQRKQLLSQSVTEDCAFTSPAAEDSGVDAFTAHIEAFQVQYPGAFFKTNKILSHHKYVLAEWIMCLKDGSVFLPGTSCACYHEDGRIMSVVGFWTL